MPPVCEPFTHEPYPPLPVASVAPTPVQPEQSQLMGILFSKVSLRLLIGALSGTPVPGRRRRARRKILRKFPGQLRVRCSSNKKDLATTPSRKGQTLASAPTVLAQTEETCAGTTGGRVRDGEETAIALRERRNGCEAEARRKGRAIRD